MQEWRGTGEKMGNGKRWREITKVTTEKLWTTSVPLIPVGDVEIILVCDYFT